MAKKNSLFLFNSENWKSQGHLSFEFWISLFAKFHQWKWKAGWAWVGSKGKKKELLDNSSWLNFPNFPIVGWQHMFSAFIGGALTHAELPNLPKTNRIKTPQSDYGIKENLYFIHLLGHSLQKKSPKFYNLFLWFLHSIFSKFLA